MWGAGARPPRQMDVFIDCFSLKLKSELSSPLFPLKPFKKIVVSRAKTEVVVKIRKIQLRRVQNARNALFQAQHGISKNFGPIQMTGRKCGGNAIWAVRVGRIGRSLWRAPLLARGGARRNRRWRPLPLYRSRHECVCVVWWRYLTTVGWHCGFLRSRHSHLARPTKKKRVRHVPFGRRVREREGSPLAARGNDRGAPGRPLRC